MAQIDNKPGVDLASPSNAVNAADLRAAALAERSVKQQVALGLPNLDPRPGPDTSTYTSPDPNALEPGRSMYIITNDAQAIALKKWLDNGGQGAMVVSDIRGTKYGFHHAGSPAPQNTHYNISCGNETSGGNYMGVNPWGDNRTNFRYIEVRNTGIPY
jgi:hypothetical protein